MRVVVYPSSSAILRLADVRGATCHAFSYSTVTKPQSSAVMSPSALSSLELHDSKAGLAQGTKLLEAPQHNGLAILPLTGLLRNYLITTISTTSWLLKPGMAFLSLVVRSKSAFLSPEKNPVLGTVLRRTFYNHFCAGENERQVKATVNSLRKLGFEGAILAFAREIIVERGRKLEVIQELGDKERSQIEAWRDGTLKTVKLAGERDMVALKFSGAGEDTVARLLADAPPSKLMYDSITQICDLAAERGVPLLFDAEQDNEQRAIDRWTLEFMAKYNTLDKPAVVYNTYQTYLKGCGPKLANHMNLSSEKGFKLGVKLVRGAYLGSDPREVIWDTKEETDKCFDGIVASILTGSWDITVDSGKADVLEEALLRTDIVIASHNQESVEKARAIEASTEARQGRTLYAQLLGMADDLSCELVTSSEPPKVLKYVVWGTTTECLHYLLRRAHENKDALGRTLETHREIGKEIRRRFRLGVGW